MVMCPKQKQNANWSQVEIEMLIVKGRNLPRTNSTKSETQIIFAKKQQNEHTPDFFKQRRGDIYCDYNPWGVLVLLKFWHFSSELTKSWSSGARKYWTQKLISNLTFSSFLLFVYMSVFYNTVPILFTK